MNLLVNAETFAVLDTGDNLAYTADYQIEGIEMADTSIIEGVNIEIPADYAPGLYKYNNGGLELIEG